jgi:hypothetical protein
MKRVLLASLLACLVLDESINARVQAEEIAVAQCDPALQQNLAPIYFQVFNTLEGETLSISEYVQIMARFPDGVCNLPDPELAGPGCTPKLNIAISKLGANGVTVNQITLEGARGVAKIAKKFGLDYSMQEGFYDEILGIPANPWLFYLQVEAGMSTQAAGGLQVNWIEIPKECSRSPITFNTSRIFYDNDALRPKISIDTYPPEIDKVYTIESDGNYTADDYIDIIVEFSKPVKFSQQPDVYSQVRLDPCAARLLVVHAACAFAPHSSFCRARSSTSMPGSPTR